MAPALPGLHDAADADLFGGGIDFDFGAGGDVAALVDTAGNADGRVTALILPGPSRTFPRRPGRPREAGGR